MPGLLDAIGYAAPETGRGGGDPWRNMEKPRAPLPLKGRGEIGSFNFHLGQSGDCFVWRRIWAAKFNLLNGGAVHLAAAISRNGRAHVAGSGGGRAAARLGAWRGMARFAGENWLVLSRE